MELFTLHKSHQRWHSKSPYRASAHCKGFAPAAPRRARDLVSVPFSGLPLSRPVRIFGLVGSYPANNLIRRRPILRHFRKHAPIAFWQCSLPARIAYGVLCPVSRVLPLLRVGYLRVTEPCARAKHSFGSQTCMAKSDFDSSTRQQDQLELNWSLIAGFEEFGSYCL